MPKKSSNINILNFSKHLENSLQWAINSYRDEKQINLTKLVFSFPLSFLNQYFLKGEVVKGRIGLIHSFIHAQSTFNKNALLYDYYYNQSQRTFVKYTLDNKKLIKLNTSNNKSTLSLVMIVKNEEKHLSPCLDTVKDLVDEIILLDSGSTDNTKQIAKSYNAKWYVNTNWEGFGKQRQLAQSYASSDYILVLDADERLDQQLRRSILGVLQQPVQKDKVFDLARVDLFCGIEIKNRNWYTDKHTRLYANDTFKYSDLDVHESLDSKGVPKITLKGFLPHITNDNLYHFLAKHIRYSNDWANEKFENGKMTNLFNVFLHTWVSFIRDYIIRGGFLGGAYGFIQAMSAANYTFNKYYLLWLLNKQKNN